MVGCERPRERQPLSFLPEEPVHLDGDERRGVRVAHLTII